MAHMLTWSHSHLGPELNHGVKWREGVIRRERNIQCFQGKKGSQELVRRCLIDTLTCGSCLETNPRLRAQDLMSLMMRLHSLLGPILWDLCSLLDSKWGYVAIFSTPTALEESVLEERRQYTVHVQRDWRQGIQSRGKHSTSLPIQTKPETLRIANKSILKTWLKTIWSFSKSTFVQFRSTCDHCNLWFLFLADKSETWFGLLLCDPICLKVPCCTTVAKSNHSNCSRPTISLTKCLAIILPQNCGSLNLFLVSEYKHRTVCCFVSHKCIIGYV